MNEDTKSRYIPSITVSMERLLPSSQSEEAMQFRKAFRRYLDKADWVLGVTRETSGADTQYRILINIDVERASARVSRWLSIHMPKG